MFVFLWILAFKDCSTTVKHDDELTIYSNRCVVRYPSYAVPCCNERTVVNAYLSHKKWNENTTRGSSVNWKMEQKKPDIWVDKVKNEYDSSMTCNEVSVCINLTQRRLIIVVVFLVYGVIVYDVEIVECHSIYPVLEYIRGTCAGYIGRHLPGVD